MKRIMTKITRETILPCGRLVSDVVATMAGIDCYNCNNVYFVNTRPCGYTCGKSTQCPVAGVIACDEDICDKV